MEHSSFKEPVKSGSDPDLKPIPSLPPTKVKALYPSTLCLLKADHSVNRQVTFWPQGPPGYENVSHRLSPLILVTICWRPSCTLCPYLGTAQSLFVFPDVLGESIANPNSEAGKGSKRAAANLTARTEGRLHLTEFTSTSVWQLQTFSYRALSHNFNF